MVDAVATPFSFPCRGTPLLSSTSTDVLLLGEGILHVRFARHKFLSFYAMICGQNAETFIS